MINNHCTTQVIKIDFYFLPFVSTTTTTTIWYSKRKASSVDTACNYQCMPPTCHLSCFKPSICIITMYIHRDHLGNDHNALAAAPAITITIMITIIIIITIATAIATAIHHYYFSVFISQLRYYNPHHPAASLPPSPPLLYHEQNFFFALSFFLHLL